MTRPDAEHHAVLRLEYDGAPFCGWNEQRSELPSIAGELKRACAQLGLRHAKVRCAGRTDAGVHASAQIVDVRYDGAIAPDRLAGALRGVAHPALVAVDGCDAPPGFDARADATSRSYEYRVLTRRAPSPLRAGRVVHHPRPLDVEMLDAAARAVVGQHDFTAFTPSKTSHVFFARTVDVSRWEQRDDELVYVIRANALLRHMVRILVGTMLDVGRGGGMTLDEFVSVLDGAARSNAGVTAPPHGLCFHNVTWRPVDGLPTPPGWQERDGLDSCTVLGSL